MNSNKSIFYSLLISVLIITACKNTDKQVISDSYSRIDSLLSQLNKDSQFNGAFFIANRDSISFLKTYGYSDIPKQTDLTNETLFEIASVSKTLTATLIMKLIENGDLSLNSRLVDYFPEMPYDDITVEHLLTHTSGIPFYYDSLIVNHWGVGRQLSTDTIFMLYEKVKPIKEFKARQKFRYSNAGFMLLSGIAEKATDKSFDELLEEYIFKPANMNSTKRDIFLSDGDDYALGHQLSIERGQYVPLSMHEDHHTFFDYYFKDSKGPGGIYTNLNDLWKFSLAIQHNTILNDESKKSMFTVGTLNDSSKTSYGKGWQLSSSNGNQYAHHRGGSEGSNCFYFIALDEGYTYFLVSNVKTYYLSEINNQIKNIISGEPVSKVTKSGFERISLKLSAMSQEEIEEEIAFIQKHSDQYYFALHEFNELAWKYWVEENYEEGMKIIRLATLAMPNNAGAFEVLAESYMELGKNELAIENYNTTIDMLKSDDTKKDKKWVKEWIFDMEKIIEKLSKN